MPIFSSRRPTLSLRHCFAFAAVAVLLQVAIVYALAPLKTDFAFSYRHVCTPEWWKSNPPEYKGWTGKFLKFNAWDSLHYMSIVRNGYTISGSSARLPAGSANIQLNDIHCYRTNEAWLPGYPILARALHLSTGIPPEYALLILAQTMALLCWLYLFLFLRNVGSTVGRSLMTAGFVFAFPMTFYLVVGYSESTFITAVLGYLYWYRKARQDVASPYKGLVYLVLASTHGFLMTATRIIGVPLALAPIFFELGSAIFGSHKRAPWRWTAVSFLIAAVSLAGFLSYLLFLQFQFGSWHVYFDVQSTGWNNKADPFAFFRMSTYLPKILTIHTSRFPDDLGRYAIPLIMIFIFYLGRAYWRVWRRDLAGDFPIFFSLAAIFGITVIGKANGYFGGMLRYLVPFWFCAAALAPPVLSLFEKNDTGTPRFTLTWMRAHPVSTTYFVLCAILQTHLAYRHLGGYYVS